jgi:hypothetical protein
MERSSSSAVGIYQLRSDGDHFNGIHPEGDDDGFIYRFNGQAIGSSWIPPRVQTEKAYDGRSWRDRDGNFTEVVGVPVFDDRALEVLYPLIADKVEVLPLAHPIKRLFGINVLVVLDCLDYERSKVARARDGGVILIDNYFFIPGMVEGHHIFKIREFPLSTVFVSEEFKQRVEANGLLGFAFWAIGEDGALIRPEPPPRPRRKPR